MRFFVSLLLFSALLAAQTSEVSAERAGGLPGVKVDGLTAAQKAQVLGIAREEGCTCGCSMKIAPCLAQDRSCMVSRTQATALAREIKAGKSPKAAAAVLSDAAYMAKLQNELASQPVDLKVAGAPARGPASARLTIVEFSDFQCPFCRTGAKALTEIAEAYPKDVRLVFKQFPLESHSQAALAAEASLAAQAQGKFWEMHDRIFANPRSLTEANLVAWAKEFGMDAGRFASDLTSHKYQNTVQAEVREGLDAGVQGTPTVFLNGRPYRGAVEVEGLKPAVEAALKAVR
ncbi:MAG: DsbA family protein [Acidobacteriota bacterium]